MIVIYIEPTVLHFFHSSKKYHIPEYKGGYKWELSSCEYVWTGIINFKKTKTLKEKYCFGSIICYKDSNGAIHVHDGQQRIITLFLLFRAIYQRVDDISPAEPERQVITEIKKMIHSIIWPLDQMSQNTTDKKEIRIINNYDNNNFIDILNTGSVTCESKDHYTQNYEYFINKCNELDITGLYTLFQTLSESIIFPYYFDNLEAAQTFTLLSGKQSWPRIIENPFLIRE